MKDKSRHSQKSHQGDSRSNKNNYCICHKCGYKIIHSRGVPCRSLTCPVCNIPLVRESDNFTNEITTDAGNKNNHPSLYPEVNNTLCTGCGNCIEVCPTDSITIINGKAKISILSCINCRVCVNECPSTAIS